MGHAEASRDDLGALLELAAAGSPRAELTRAFEAAVERRAHARLRAYVDRDLLTSVFSRRRFVGALESALRSGRGGAVALLDLDDFQRANDALGHQAADALLVAVAERLRSAAADGDIVARHGGDRFLVLRHGRFDTATARAFGCEVLRPLGSPVELDGRRWDVSASVGVVVLGDHGADGTGVLRFAGEAGVRAKALGGGRVEVLDEASARQLRERIELEHALTDAVDNDGLELAYQPVVSLTDGHTAYAEALLRWRRRDAGLVPPSEFVPVAEESGLIRRLGRWVLETACREHGAWALQEPDTAPPRVAVNVSAREIVDPGFPEAVGAVIERTGVAASALVLEVTETALLDATDSARDVMQRLTDLGIQIVLDDFGDGFSSLAHLRWFPVHGLKIDRSLIADLGVRPEARPIVEAVVAMARAVGIGTVAEGIETDAQLDAVRELGCDFAQGYALGRPAPPPGAGAPSS